MSVPGRTTHHVLSTAVALALAAALVLAGCGSDASSTGPGGGYGATRTSGAAEEPAEGADPSAGWPAPGRDLRGSRAVVDSPINASTIGGLTEAWRVALPGPGVIGNIASTPLILGDTVIVQDLSSTVRALDLRTGAVKWAREYDLTTIGPNGPAVGDGRVFVAKGTKEVAALDLESGREIWTTPLTSTPTEGIDIQPQAFDGLVFVSTVPISLQGQYTGGDRGVLYALDSTTGKVRWQFDTVAGDDLWGNDQVNSGGGAWFPPSIDADRGLVYWGVANPAPFPGTALFPNGSSRPGPNLYTDSVVALDARTGELKWYQQAVEHDLFDRDLIHTLIVRDRDGRDVVVATGKLGRVIGHDPTTGEVLWDTPIGEHHNDDLTELDGPTAVLPGTYGGVLTPPAAADGVVYAAVINAPTTLAPDRPSYIGSELGTLPRAGVAVDAADGRLLWSTPIDGDPLGGAIVLGDLVLTGTQDGLLVALDRATGDVVWTLQAPGQLNGWPASAGDTLLWPIGLADPPVLLALRLPAN